MTVFIIFAIILVITGVVAFYLTKTGGSTGYFNSHEIKPQVDSIKETVFDCFKTNSDGSLELIGAQGGYYNKPGKEYDLGWAFIPYYFYEGEDLMPTKDKISMEIGSYIDNNLKICIDRIQSNDLELSYNEPKTQVEISPGNIKFVSDMKFTLKKDGNLMVFELKDMPYTKESKIYEMIEIGRYLTDSQVDDPNYVCATCIDKMCQERKIYFDMVNFIDNSTKLIILSENETSPDGNYFQFLNKYK